MARHRKVSWLIPAGLLTLCVIPMLAGVLRLIQLAGGPEQIPADDRFASFPLPLILHIVAACIYLILGAFQFVPRFRRNHPGWHRIAGRVLAAAGLIVAGSAIWMTLFYAMKPGTGTLLYVLRLVFGLAMAVCIILGVTTVRRGDVGAHRAWMIRAYAIGIAAGTQAFTGGIGGALIGTSTLGRDLAMSSAWVINLAVAQWVILHPLGPAPSRRSDDSAELTVHSGARS